MRLIKFRGKVARGSKLNEWMFVEFGTDAIQCGFDYNEPYFNNSPVIRNTIGQYTGLKDKNGVEIYEWDILEFEHGGKCKAYVAYRDGAFDVKNEHQDVLLYLSVVSEKSKVIGNIFDDPELIDS